MTPPDSTIFVVDDDRAVLKAVARLLAADGWRVQTFASAEDFLARATSTASGCLLLDVNLPGVDGLTLQQQLHESGWDLPIVFLTGHGDIPMSVRAMRAGASDFLTKPVQSEALNTALHNALDQHTRRLEADGDLAALRRQLDHLTPRELDVLNGLADGKLNKQIAHDLGIVEQTVKFHRARIMERLGAKSVAELMLMVARAKR